MRSKLEYLEVGSKVKSVRTVTLKPVRCEVIGCSHE